MRVSLCDFHNIWEEGVIHVNGRAHPIGLFRVATENLWPPKASIGNLARHFLPKIPRIPFPVFHFGVIRGCVLIAIASAIDARAIRDENQIIFRKGDSGFLAFESRFDRSGDFLALFVRFDHDIIHFAARDELNAAIG